MHVYIHALDVLRDCYEKGQFLNVFKVKTICPSVKLTNQHHVNIWKESKRENRVNGLIQSV